MYSSFPASMARKWNVHDFVALVRGSSALCTY